jgi:hypothetical protein
MCTAVQKQDSDAGKISRRTGVGLLKHQWAPGVAGMAMVYILGIRSLSQHCTVLAVLVSYMDALLLGPMLEATTELASDGVDAVRLDCLSVSHTSCTSVGSMSLQFIAFVSCVAATALYLCVREFLSSSLIRASRSSQLHSISNELRHCDTWYLTSVNYCFTNGDIAGVCSNFVLFFKARTSCCLCANLIVRLPL